MTVVKKIFTVMLPILASQLAIVGMQACDVAMSGHAGAEELAGSSVGSSIIMPIIATCIGLLMAATPIIAHLIGGQQKDQIGAVVKTGLGLALVLEIILLLMYFLGVDLILDLFLLTPHVRFVAKYYLLAIVLGMAFGMLTFPMRALVETLISTSLAMKIYLLALPVNALFNYAFIFGHFGMPALGGIGAGVATALSYLFVLIVFLFLLYRHRDLKDLQILKASLKLHHWREYIALGLPNALGIFVETSIFGCILIFVSKFGTAYTAAHQVAMNVASICYMIPLSYSLALTIIIGVEIGGKQYAKAKHINATALKISFISSCLLSILAFLGKDYIAHLYAQDPILINLIPQFLLYVILWQIFDSIATPTLGILRGYKDVKIPSCINMLAYWFLCFPLGICLDLQFNQGAFSYWQSLVLGIFASMVFLAIRLYKIQRKYSSNN